MSKGSRPRPYSVSQAEFGNNYDAIFRKKDKIAPATEQMSQGGPNCGCGRSPTGKCIGWHSLSQESFEARLSEYNAQKDTLTKNN